MKKIKLGSTGLEVAELGFGAMYLKHIRQANDGCDFDFLEAGGPTPDPEIH